MRISLLPPTILFVQFSSAQIPASIDALLDTDIDQMISNRTTNTQVISPFNADLRKLPMKNAASQTDFDAFWQMAYFLLNDDASTKEEFVEKFTNYGCQCFIEDGVSPGGKSVIFKDNIDQLCRNFALCRQCIDIDARMDLRKSSKFELKTEQNSKLKENVFTLSIIRTFLCIY